MSLSTPPPPEAPPPPNASSQSRHTVKRACDACKVRKVRCSNTTPCACCVAIGIPCTFNKHPSTRGPRKLRAKTIQSIVEVQRRESSQSGDFRDQEQQSERAAAQQRAPSLPGTGNGLPILPAPRLSTTSGSVAGLSRSSLPLAAAETPLPPLVASPPAGFAGSPAPQKSRAVTPIATLVLQLCVYRLRMFPVWPIVAVEDLMAALQKDGVGKDMEAYALANAVAAATIAQLKLSPLRNSAEVVTGESMEAEVQRVRGILPMKLNLNRLRTAFFLHVYHENLDAGGINSLLYLREAITMAQIMGLHKESSYENLPSEEQQFRRRVLWLLFVTERGVAMLHKLPVVLKSNIAFPAMEYDEEVSILPAFRKLVNLFWIFDQSAAFDILQNSSSGSSTPQSTNQTVLTVLQKRLQEIPIDSGATNDVQAADICVTRAWMRAVLWRMTVHRGNPSATEQTSSLAYPTQIAKEFLAVISNLPTTAIESHGPSMELKLYEIACAVIDSISRSPFDSSDPIWEETSPQDVLDQLQRILSSCRGGNTVLVERLQERIAEMQPPHSAAAPLMQPNSSFGTNIDDPWLQGRHPSDAQQENSIDFRSDQATVSPDFSQQQQQFVSFPWDAIAEENHLPGFEGTFDHIEPSAVLDRFLGDTMGDNWSTSLMRGTTTPVSQWL